MPSPRVRARPAALYANRTLPILVAGTVMPGGPTAPNPLAGLAGLAGSSALSRHLSTARSARRRTRQSILLPVRNPACSMPLLRQNRHGALPFRPSGLFLTKIARFFLEKSASLVLLVSRRSRADRQRSTGDCSLP